MRCHHYCNMLYCPECIRRFWQWAQHHTRSKGKRKGPNFYDHVNTPGLPSGTASVPHTDEKGSSPLPGTDGGVP